MTDITIIKSTAVVVIISGNTKCLWPPGGHCAQPGAPGSPSQASVFTVLCPHLCRRCGLCQELWQIGQRVERTLEPTGGLKQCPTPFCTPFPGATAPVSRPCRSPRSPQNASLTLKNPKVSILNSWVLSPVLRKCCPHISLPPSLPSSQILLATSLQPRLHPPVPQLHTPPWQEEVGSHIVPTPTPRAVTQQQLCLLASASAHTPQLPTQLSHSILRREGDETSGFTGQEQCPKQKAQCPSMCERAQSVTDSDKTEKEGVVQLAYGCPSEPVSSSVYLARCWEDLVKLLHKGPALGQHWVNSGGYMYCHLSPDNACEDWCVVSVGHVSPVN